MHAGDLQQVEEAYMHIPEFRNFIAVSHEAPDAFIRTNSFSNSYNETSRGYHANRMEGCLTKKATSYYCSLVAYSDILPQKA